MIVGMKPFLDVRLTSKRCREEGEKEAGDEVEEEWIACRRSLHTMTVPIRRRATE
jgi:hypothetical protein